MSEQHKPVEQRCYEAASVYVRRNALSWDELQRYPDEVAVWRAVAKVATDTATARAVGMLRSMRGQVSAEHTGDVLKQLAEQLSAAITRATIDEAIMRIESGAP